MRQIKVILAGLIVLALAGCEAGREKETLGTLLGAAAGAAIGSQIGSGAGQAVAIGVGALAGGVAGSLIGRELDAQDRQRAQQAARESIRSTPTGSSSTWRNPDSGNQGSYTPVSETFVNDKGETCRNVQQNIIVDGQERTDEVTICEKPDGTVVASN